MDSEATTYDRLTPARAIGLVVHELGDSIASGALEPRREALAERWGALIQQQYERMRAQWSPAEVPPPRSWRRINVVRARTLKRLGGVSNKGQRPSSHRSEAWLEDPITGLRGRPDRITTTADGRVLITDVKTRADVGVTPEDRVQLLLYAWLLQAQDGVRAAGLSIQDAAGTFHELDWSWEEVEGQVVRSQHAVEEANSWLTRGDGLAHPSSEACSRCFARPICGPFQSAIGAEVLVSGCAVGRVESVEVAEQGTRAVLRDAAKNISSDVFKVPCDVAVGQTMVVVDAYEIPESGALVAQWNTVSRTCTP